MAGLLGGVLPAIYSGADQLKRQVYGLLTNPQEQAQRAAQSLLQSRAERQALMARTFANPERPFQVTDQAGLSQLTDQVMSGELGFAPAGITAFHGSPYTFNKFDVTKGGSGQGTQNYGRGTYFAENPKVAEGYTGRTVIQEPTIERFTFNGSDYSLADGQFLKNNKPLSEEEYKKAFDGISNLWNTQNKGALYKVDIPDEKIPNMLNWYEEVPEKVRNKLSKKALDEFGSGLTGTSGRDLYKDLAFTFKMQGSKAPEIDAANWLNSNGVSGIKYENFQVKSGQGADTFNYVVFDPTDVKILERNNQPVEGLLGSTNLMPIYHGTDPKAAKAIEKSGFDINKSADGTIWFTSNPEIGEVAATGKGAVVQRYLDENKVKLGGWDEIDKFSVDELIQKGFDGVKLQDETGTVFQIFNPEKLTK
jgi:hypothetical protein